MLIAAVAFVLVAAGSWFARREPDRRSGSVRVETGRVRVAKDVQRSYRITYRVQDHTSDIEDRTETVEVRRPFDSRTTSAVSTFGRTRFGRVPFYAAPGPPPGDLRPDAMLGDALDDGYAAKRELRRVAERLCRVYRIGAPAEHTSLPPVREGNEPTDVCVDEAGLVLEEVTYGRDDEVARRRIATSVTEHPRFGDASFDVDDPDGDPRQVGSVQELDDDSRLPGGTFWVLRRPPKDFFLHGRYAVVPAGQPGFNDPTSRNNVISFVTEVWTSGPDVLTIDQGATQGSVPFEKDPNARPVKDDDLGTGELRYSMIASEVRFNTGGARFVRVRGTRPPAELLTHARALIGVPEGPLLLKERPD